MKDTTFLLAFNFILFVVQSLADMPVIFHEKVSHSEARSKCEEKDGVLAKLDKKDITISSEPQDYQDRHKEDFWIGLIRDGNGWKWLDGSRLGSWNNWRVKEPSSGEDFKDCVEMQMFRNRSGTNCSHWRVRNCNESKAYICAFFQNECVINNPCQHGGRCIFNTADGSTSCNCSTTGYQGINCTELTTTEEPYGQEPEDSDTNYAFLILGIVAGVHLLGYIVAFFVVKRNARKRQPGRETEGQVSSEPASHTASASVGESTQEQGQPQATVLGIRSADFTVSQESQAKSASSNAIMPPTTGNSQPALEPAAKHPASGLSVYGLFYTV